LPPDPPPIDRVPSGPSEAWRASKAEPWIIERPLAKPMQRLSPDGVKPLLERQAVHRGHTRDWLPRTPLRSLSIAAAAMGRGTSTGSRSATPVGSPSVCETPVPVTAKLVAMRDRALLGRIPKAEDDGCAVSPSALCSQDVGRSLRHSRSVPELKQWTSKGFEFEDVLSAYCSSADTLAASCVTSADKRSSSAMMSKTMPLRGRMASQGSDDSGVDEDAVDISPARKSMNHARRNLVQKISLEPRNIC